MPLDRCQGKAPTTTRTTWAPSHMWKTLARAVDRQDLLDPRFKDQAVARVAAPSSKRYNPTLACRDGDSFGVRSPLQFRRSTPHHAA